MSINAYRSSINNTLSRHSEHNNTIYFLSWLQPIDDYLVGVVLQLDKKVYNKYYSLIVKEKDGINFSISLLEATINEFLRICSEELRKADPGIGLAIIDRDYDEVIRSGGEKLMYTIAAAGGEYYGLHSLFKGCNNISSLKYEGEECRSGLIIASPKHENVAVKIAFKDKININNYRLVRKLLQTASEDLYLLSDSYYVYGLGNIVGKYDFRKEEIFIVKFHEHYCWSVEHYDRELMRVSYRIPRLPKEKIDREKFCSDIKRIFPDITQKQINNLWDLVIAATRQHHGTTVLISQDAESEAERLSKQSIRLDKLKLDENLIGLLCSIDGALLIDVDGYCYAIGMILDGVANKNEDNSRGARYNSVIRYTNGKNKVLAVVISEDGMINPIPTLMPQIPKTTIPELIQQLEQICDENEPNPKAFNRTMEWFKSHQFYLRVEESNKVNSLKVKYQDKFKNSSDIWIVYEDISPNPEIEDSYFIDDEKAI